MHEQMNRQMDTYVSTNTYIIVNLTYIVYIQKILTEHTAQYNT